MPDQRPERLKRKLGAGGATMMGLGSMLGTYVFVSINLAALRLPKEHRLYPRWISLSGLLACLFLAFWVPVHIWTAGLGLIGIGLLWKFVASRIWVGR